MVMRYSDVIDKITGMGLNKYRRNIIPREFKIDVPAKEMLVEKIEIFVDKDMLLSQIRNVFKSIRFPVGCYATIAIGEEQNMYVTNVGCQKVVYFEGEFYSSLMELDKRTKCDHRSAFVEKIIFCFNAGSYKLMFSNTSKHP